MSKNMARFHLLMSPLVLSYILLSEELLSTPCNEDHAQFFLSQSLTEIKAPTSMRTKEGSSNLATLCQAPVLLFGLLPPDCSFVLPSLNQFLWRLLRLLLARPVLLLLLLGEGTTAPLTDREKQNRVVAVSQSEWVAYGGVTCNEIIDF